MIKAKYVVLPLLLALALVLVGCPEDTPLQPVVNTGSADFSTLVAVGNSLTAGVTDGALGEFGQKTSYPKLIADIVGADFNQPLIEDPGLGRDASGQPAGRLVLKSLVPLTIESLPLTKAPLEMLKSFPPYNNLAVPGATTNDVLNTVTDNGGIADLILQGRGTQVQQAAAMNPTFILAWAGNNDVLGAALSGVAIDGQTMTPTSIFQQLYSALIDALSATGAKIVVANIPDVTVIPFVTTLPPVLVDPVTQQPVRDSNGNLIPLIGTFSDGRVGPLSTDPTSDNFAFVNLTATSLLKQGIGIPQAAGGTGQPLPNQVLIDRAELVAIRTKVAELNGVIQSVAGAKNIPVVDINALLFKAKDPGIDIGGITVTADFVTGGVISLDGFHATPLGYGIVANAFIRKINEAYGASIPLVNLRALLGIPAGAVGKRINPFDVDSKIFEAVVRLETGRPLY